MKLLTTKLIAACAYTMLATALFALQACANIGASVGIGFPIGGLGSIGVSVGSGGRVGGSVGVGAGGASVGVGTYGQLPASNRAEDAKKPEEVTKH